MPKQDRNNVVLGPARMSLEDEALARARMTATRRQVLQPAAETYPLRRIYTEPGFSFVTDHVWNVLDTSSIGGYSRSLVSTGGVLNLDNIAQGIKPDNWLDFGLSGMDVYGFGYPEDKSFSPFAKSLSVAMCPKFRDNILHVGTYFRADLAATTPWQTTPLTGTYNGTPVTFNRLHTDMWRGYSDETYCYFTSLATDFKYYLVRVPHEGSLAVEILNAVPWQIFSYQYRVVGVFNNFVWCVKFQPDLLLDDPSFYTKVTLFNLSTGGRQEFSWDPFGDLVDPRTAFVDSSNGTVMATPASSSGVLYKINLAGEQAAISLPGPAVNIFYVGYPLTIEEAGTTTIVLPEIGAGYFAISSTGAVRQELMLGLNEVGPGWAPDGIGTKTRWISGLDDEGGISRLYEVAGLPGG